MKLEVMRLDEAQGDRGVAYANSGKARLALSPLTTSGEQWTELCQLILRGNGGGCNAVIRQKCWRCLWLRQEAGQHGA